MHYLHSNLVLLLTASAAMPADETSFGSHIFFVSSNARDVVITFGGNEPNPDVKFGLLEPESIIFGSIEELPLNYNRNLEKFRKGEELIFYITNNSDPRSTFFTGPADRNPDKRPHAQVMSTATGLRVGFEESYGGGDAGLGLNLSLPAEARTSLELPEAQPVADLDEALGEQAPRRNLLAGMLAAAVLDTLDEFARVGYAAFASRWAGLDALAGARVRVTQAEGCVEGEACGAEADGALLVRVAGVVQRFYSGDVSLRAATP